VSSIEVILSGLGLRLGLGLGLGLAEGSSDGTGEGDSEGRTGADGVAEPVIVVTFLSTSDPVELASMIVMLAPSMVNSVPPKAKT
jgi:hypothetical protein